jgi:putative membrane protein
VATPNGTPDSFARTPHPNTPPLPQSSPVSVPIGPLLLAAAGLGAYGVRWRRVRADPRGARPAAWRAVSWTAGVACIFFALAGPIDADADDLLVMHMVQHVLLLDIAPVLLLLGLTRVLLRPVTRALGDLERAAGPLAHPAFAVAFYVGVMWLWHIPALYDAALAHPLLHVLEHMLFGLAGGLYWWHLLSPIRSRRRLPGLGPIVYMVVSKLGLGFLGIALTFAPDALYPHYADGPRRWGLTADDDQALAGLVMALEQSILMGIALAWLFARMLGESEREEQRAERYGAA